MALSGLLYVLPQCLLFFVNCFPRYSLWKRKEQPRIPSELSTFFKKNSGRGGHYPQEIWRDPVGSPAEPARREKQTGTGGGLSRLFTGNKPVIEEVYDEVWTHTAIHDGFLCGTISNQETLPESFILHHWKWVWMGEWRISRSWSWWASKTLDDIPRFRKSTGE